jgi:carbon-monoxide dehydrogenase small subunit
MRIELTLNQEKRTMEVEQNDVLLDVLRDKFGCKSPKCGCDRGDCGACTVFINGQGVRSCLVLAAEVHGQTVVTAEGLSKDGLNSVQRAFARRNAFQCGYCAPGMTLAATELLAKKPHPCRADVQEALAGNLCRCTGYEPIIEAVLEAAANREDKP